MIATALLRKEHEEVRDLLARLEEEHGAERRRERLREVAAILILHARMEERFFYSALEETENAEVAQLLSEARSDHSQIEDLIEQLIAMDGREVAFERGLSDLEPAFRRHVRGEEARLFPLAERLVGEPGLATLGRAMVEWRRRLDAAA